MRRSRCCSCGLLQRRQRRLDFLAARFQETRQLEVTAERGYRLVDGETGVVGRDLEEDAAGLAEVDRAEVLTILLFGRLQAMLVTKPRGHCGLCGIILGAKRDVVYRATAHGAPQEALGLMKIDDTAGIGAIAADRAFGPNSCKAQDIVKNCAGGCRIF